MTLFRGLALLVMTLPTRLLGAGGGGAGIVIVADSRQFTGWKAWWTNLYNESHLWFAIATILIIPSLGLLLGRLTDFLMSKLGINLKSRVLAEH